MTTSDRRPPRDAEEQRRARGRAVHSRESHGHEFRSLRERVAATRWRRAVAARRATHHTYRLVVGIVGALIVVVGIITIPLPGPGWLTVIFGLVVLASEFLWAERLLGFTRRHVRRWTDWVGAQPVWVRVLIALATAAFVYGVLVVVLHLVTVPAWLPGWVPMWR